MFYGTACHLAQQVLTYSAWRTSHGMGDYAHRALRTYAQAIRNVRGARDLRGRLRLTPADLRAVRDALRDLLRQLR